MYCILFEFTTKIYCNYFYFFVNTRGYPWIFVYIKKICGFPHNGYPHGYGYGYEVDIYRTGKVRGATTRPVDDIPSCDYKIGKS